MYKIGILSDTHGLLRKEVKEILTTCDSILHCGDIGPRNLLEELQAIAPVTAVKGNIDKDLTAVLPETQSFTLYGIHFFLIHNKKHLPANLTGQDMILYGHSHKYEEFRQDGTLWLNPGSCGPRRFRLPVTLALLQVDPRGDFQVQRVDIKTDKSADYISLIRESLLTGY